METMWDSIVVGGGIIGSWTAYLLAKQGHRTLMIEQFPLPHTRGSSHGKSRIIRMTYHLARYSAMMPEAYKYWEQLEKETGKQLLIKTGLLLVETVDGKEISDSVVTMSRLNLPYEIIPQPELSKKFPQINYSDKYRGLLDPSAGMLAPDTCLKVLQNLFEKHGGVIHDGEKVISVNDGAYGVTITTDKRSYTTKKVILNPGPWAKDLLENTGLQLPLKTMPGCQSYWAIKSAVTYGPLPIIRHPVKSLTASRENYRFFYMFPSVEYRGLVKINTRGEPPPCYLHPDKRDQEGHQEMLDLVTSYIRKHLPGIEDKPSITEPCVYTMTPDREYVLDFHPRSNNIIIGAGFSGHGFKLAPVVGKLITEMVSGSKPSYDLTPFKISRFNNTTSKL